jgi:hypothetical protein
MRTFPFMKKSKDKELGRQLRRQLVKGNSKEARGG